MAIEYTKDGKLKKGRLSQAEAAVIAAFLDDAMGSFLHQRTVMHEAMKIQPNTKGLKTQYDYASANIKGLKHLLAILLQAQKLEVPYGKSARRRAGRASFGTGPGDTGPCGPGGELRDSASPGDESAPGSEGELGEAPG